VPVPVEVEPELQHNATTFVALESDLGLLFGSTTLCPQQQQPLGPSHISHTPHTPHLSQTSHLSQISKSYSRSEYEEEIAELKNREVDYKREIADLKNKEQIWQKEMTELRSTIEQLELDNIDLSEGLARVTEQNKQLKEDSDLQTQDARSSMQELKMSLKEKQEEVRSGLFYYIICQFYVLRH
jgi:DNA repair exonuclease SbcCD ATPase subunit